MFEDRKWYVVTIGMTARNTESNPCDEMRCDAMRVVPGRATQRTFVIPKENLIPLGPSNLLTLSSLAPLSHCDRQEVSRRDTS